MVQWSHTKKQRFNTITQIIKWQCNRYEKGKKERRQKQQIHKKWRAMQQSWSVTIKLRSLKAKVYVTVLSAKTIISKYHLKIIMRKFTKCTVSTSSAGIHMMICWGIIVKNKGLASVQESFFCFSLWSHGFPLGLPEEKRRDMDETFVHSFIIADSDEMSVCEVVQCVTPSFAFNPCHQFVLVLAEKSWHMGKWLLWVSEILEICYR